MQIKEYSKDLISMVSLADENQTYELEALIKNYQNNKISQEMFNSVLKRLNGDKNCMFDLEEEYLDISINLDEKTRNNIRFTIIGKENIITYCKTEDINSIDENDIIILQKNNIKYVDLNEYRVKFNLKNEKILSKKAKEVKSIISKWSTLKKIFRYKKRISFKTTDHLFQYDMTLLKTSNKENKTIPGRPIKKKMFKDKPHLKKFMQPPIHIKDIDGWFSKFKPNDDVPMKGRTIEDIKSFKSVKQSNVFNNDVEYEVELEYIGNKSEILKKPSSKEILIKMIQNVIIILQCINKSYYIISESEKNDVKKEYQAIMGDYKFNGPMNVTLEKKHIIEHKYEDYNNIVSIRKHYSVTDKADGERNLLIIVSTGKMYLMNRKNDIKYIGASCTELAGTILDTEYILKDKDDKNINLLMIFDAYFYKGEDLRNKILENIDDEDTTNKARLNYVNDAYDIINEKLVLEVNNNLEISLKEFEFGDIDEYDEEIEKLIDEQILELTQTDGDDTDEINKINEVLANLKADTKIFKMSSGLLEKENVRRYKTDGLIFTPINLVVGEDPKSDKAPKFNGRWYSSFKWKPPEQNTIDFLVEIMKDPENTKNDLIKYNSDGISYKTLILKIGYDPRRHNKHNSFRLLNENIVYEQDFKPINFVPIEPYIKDSYLAPVIIENGNIYTDEDKNIISDGMIIECKYDIDSTNIFKWLPMRVRDNLTPNDFITSSNVWNCIHNPVTLQMITSGKVDHSEKYDVYYNRKLRRDQRKCNPMYDFHSFIKRKLITENVLGDKNLLDTSIGKGGDLNHWVSAKVNLLVGLDISLDGLIDSDNGACNRILDKSVSTNNIKLSEQSLIVWGDTSKNMINGNAGLDDLNKYYLNIIYGNILFEDIANTKLQQFHNLGNISNGGGFDTISSQFSIHYYFKNEDSLNTYLYNISNSLKKGGRFIGTCLNGLLVFNNLVDAEDGTIKNNDKDLCWKITKKYNQPELNPNNNSLGLEIDVYNESIGVSFKEYLVNIDYLTLMCEKFKLNLIETNSFRKIYDSISKEKKKYGEIHKMTDQMKIYSFMNSYFIYEKQ